MDLHQRRKEEEGQKSPKIVILVGVSSNRFATSPELSREWKKIGMKASSRTVRRRLWTAHLPSRRTAKKPPLSKKNIRTDLLFTGSTVKPKNARPL